VRVEEMRLTIEPEAEVGWSRDLFGNSVATAHFSDPAEQLRIRSDILLEQTWSFPLRSARPATPVAFPVTFSGLESVIAAAYRETVYPDDLARVRKWVNETVLLDSAQGGEAAVAAITSAIRQTIKYRRRDEKGVQTPTAAIAQKSGSCRDMATLMLEALRALGLPARFASGYLDCAASEAGRASTHAWAEAYLPQVGWIGYDPTLGEPTSGKHVVTGVSNHPRGVMPISGSFFDKEKSYLGMEVSVQIGRINQEEGRSRHDL
jgi:transglutaminase-like putative cysteine protease